MTSPDEISPGAPAPAGGARGGGDAPSDGSAGTHGGPRAAALRIGDKERDEVTRLLHDAFAQGRITREELDERLDATLSARTAEDLRRVTADLPGAWADDGWAGGPGARAAWRPGFPSPGLPRLPGFPVGAPGGPYRGHGAWGHGAWGHRMVARRHGRHPHPAMFLVPLAAIAVLAAGPMWPPFLVLKLLVIALLVRTALGLAHHRRHHGYPGRR